MCGLLRLGIKPWFPAPAGRFFTTGPPGNSPPQYFYESESEKVKVKSLSCVRLSVTTWTVAYQTSPSMEFSWQEYCSGLPFPSPGDLSDPGIESGSPALQADTLPSQPLGKSSLKQISALIFFLRYI